MRQNFKSLYKIPYTYTKEKYDLWNNTSGNSFDKWFCILSFRVSCLCAAWEVTLQHGIKHNSKAIQALKYVLSTVNVVIFAGGKFHGVGCNFSDFNRLIYFHTCIMV